MEQKRGSVRIADKIRFNKASRKDLNQFIIM